MSNIIKELLTITYEMSIDTNTGEIIETKIISKEQGSKKSSFPKKKEDNREPMLILFDTKYELTPAAMELIGANPDDKIDIKYEKNKPIIGLDSTFGTKQGNRITKTNTVAYKGAKNEELAKHGTEFKVIPHPTKEGLFILESGKEIVELKGDENIEVNDDFNIDDLIENTDQIDANFFKF